MMAVATNLESTFPTAAVQLENHTQTLYARTLFVEHQQKA